MQSLNALHSSLEISKEIYSEIYYVYFDFFRKHLYNIEIDNDNTYVIPFHFLNEKRYDNKYA